MRRTVALLCGLLVLLSACGNDDSDGDPSAGAGFSEPGDSDLPDADGAVPHLDPCTLLEVSDIEAELSDRGDVHDGQNRGDEMCVWKLGEELVGEAWGEVTVAIHYRPKLLDDEAELVEVAQGIFADEKGQAEGKDVPMVTVDGVGDEAFLTGTLGLVILHARSNMTVLSVSAFVEPKDEGVREKLENLTRTALDRT